MLHFSSVSLHSCSVVSSVMFMSGLCNNPRQQHLPEQMKDIVMKITFCGNSGCQSKYVSTSTVSIWIHGSDSHQEGNFFPGCKSSSQGRKTLRVNVLIPGLSITEDK